MFGILFGWTKASKCKKQIRRLQCRLKLLKSKRSFIVGQLRDEIAQLIELGYGECALNRAEQLFKDETILTTYELIDYFCDFILIHMQYISRNKDCPEHINEAVTSLIFASARCVDLPELWGIRELLVHRYGRRFAIAAAELYPGNLVNHQIKEKLIMQPVTEDIKSRLVNEIAQEYYLQRELKAIQYAIQPEQRQSYQVVLDKDTENRTIVPRLEEKTIDIDLQSNGSSTLVPCHSHFQRVPDQANTSTACSIVHSSPFASKFQESTPSGDEELNCIEVQDMYRSRVISQYTEYSHRTVKAYYTCSGNNIENVSLISSSGTLSRFLDQTVSPLDIEEYQSYMLGGGDCQDKRLFKFRPSIRAAKICRKQLGELH